MLEGKLWEVHECDETVAILGYRCWLQTTNQERDEICNSFFGNVSEQRDGGQIVEVSLLGARSGLRLERDACDQRSND